MLNSRNFCACSRTDSSRFQRPLDVHLRDSVDAAQPVGERVLGESRNLGVRPGMSTIPGTLEAGRAVAAARNLGIVRGSTLFYDLEAFNTRHSTACTSRRCTSCTCGRPRCTPTGTRRASTPAPPRASGCSTTRGSHRQPDHDARPGLDRGLGRQGEHQLVATSAATGGSPTAGSSSTAAGTTRRWGGVRINIDRNYLNLRTPRLPGSSAPTPARPRRRPPAPQLHRQARLADARCTPATINRTALPPDERRRAAASCPAAVPAQAAAPLQVRGHREVELARPRPRCRPSRHGSATRAATSSPATTGSAWSWRATAAPWCGRGSKGADVTRVQRALNAAGSPYLAVTGQLQHRDGERRRRLPAHSSASAPRRWSATRPGRHCGRGRALEVAAMRGGRAQACCERRDARW